MQPIVLAVLKHTRTYRLTVPEAIAKLYGLEKSIALELLESLCNAEMLTKAPLTPWQDYYYLGKRAAEVITVGPKDCQPLQAVTKTTAYAVLYFCCMGDVYRPRVTAEQFQQRFQTLYRPGPKINYYTEGKRLGYIRVETKHNTNGAITRVIERCGRDIQNRCTWKGGSSPEFRRLVDSGAFKLTLLTSFQSRVDRIHQELNRRRERFYQFRSTKRIRSKGGRVIKDIHREYLKYAKRGKEPMLPPPLEAHVVPGLLDLIYPKPDAAPPASTRDSSRS